MRREAVQGILVAGLAAATAAPSLGNGFVYDDVPAIVENPLLHSLANSAHVWVSSYWRAGPLYRPLTVQLFALEWWVGGGAPWPFHLVNIVLYAAVAWLVYRLARRVLPAGAALAAAALFAAHPVHVEVTANAVGQNELLAALFVLLAVERYLAWRESGGLGAPRRGALALLYLLAIAAKETGYVLPALLAAAEVLAVADRRPWRDRWRETAPAYLMLAGVALIGLLVRVIVLGGLKGEVAALPLRGLAAGERAIVMLAAAPEWFRLLLWPAHLQANYGPPALPTGAGLGARHLVGLGLLIATVALVAWAWRRAPAVALGLVWVAIALAPVSNLVTATGVLIAERTLLLPSVGAVLAAGWGIGWLAIRLTGRRAAEIGLAAGLVVLCAAGAVRSARRATVWRSQAGFFEQLERDAPGSYRAQFAAGTYFSAARRVSDAERTLSAARALYQEDPAVYETLGQLYRIEKRCDRALPIFAEGVQRHPEGTVLRSRLIECLLAVGDTARARAVARDALARGQTEFESTLRRLGEGSGENRLP